MLKLAYFFAVCLIISAYKLMVESATECVGSAELIVNSKDIILNQDLKKDLSGVLSAAECVSWCFRTVDCKSLFYNQISFRCRLHSVVFNTTTGATVEAGSMYYVLHADDITPRISPNTLEIVCGWHSEFTYVGNAEDVEMCLRHSKNDKLTFEEARTNCTMIGARLLQIETPEKIDFFSNVLLNSAFDVGSVWIAATLVNGTWLWNYDTDNPINNFNWGISDGVQQPDNDGNCIRLSYTMYYLWADLRCNKLKRFVCEIIMPSGLTIMT